MADAMVRDRPEARRKYTVADLEWLETLPEYADRRFELHEGELIDMPQPNDEHGYLAGEIYFRIRVFLAEQRLGRSTVSAGHYAIDDDETLLAPDVAFRRLDPALEPPLSTWVPRMPDLAVEVKSPNDTYAHMRRKAMLYLKRGTEIVWLVYPERRQVEVCALDADGEITSEIVGADGELSGGDVLPGFTLPLSTIFDRGG